MFEFITKTVPIRYIVLQGEDISVTSVITTLEEFVDEDEINAYYLYQHTADILVKEGVLTKYIGSRMATMYCKTDKFDEFYDSFFRENNLDRGNKNGK